MTDTALSGFELFIWPSYALAAIFVCGCILHSLIQARRAKEENSSDKDS